MRLLSRESTTARVVFILVLATQNGCRKNAEGPTAGLTGGTLVFQDDFSQWRSSDWRSQGKAWSVVDGKLKVSGAKNDALWLTQALPEKVRVEFTATSLSPDGDIKAEIFGNGHDHQSGYIAIFGGWRNSTSCMARLNEHGNDRQDRQSHQTVEGGRPYQIALVRSDRDVVFFLDGERYMEFRDAAPLLGPEHSYFAFNDWMVSLSFDDVRIYDLKP